MKRRAKETCEMCSAEVANPATIKVEGALLRVCAKCTSFGNVVKEPRQIPLSQRKKVSRTRTGRSKPQPAKKTVSSSSPKKVEAELIGDYAKLIRLATAKSKRAAMEMMLAV